MNHRLLSFLVALLSLSAPVSLSAQTGTALDSILAYVAENNTGIKAQRQALQADRLANRTATNWADPEVELGYLWGGPAAVGKRKDVSVSQSVDLATLGGQRKRLAQEQDQLSDCQYALVRQSVLLQAAQSWLSLVCLNARLERQRDRLAQAQIVQACMQRRLDAGEGNILDLRQAQMDYTACQAEWVRMESERQGLQQALDALNGGLHVEVSSTVFPPTPLPADFESWYAEVESSIPQLSAARQATVVAERNASLTRANGLPSLTIGYMGEFTRSERYQGATLGVSVPLWSNRSKVRQAKAAVQAAAAQASDLRLQLKARLHTLYVRAQGLQRAAGVYRAADLEQVGSANLRKALEGGELSLVDYLVGMRQYYDSADRVIDAEYSYRQAWLELMSVRF